MIPPENLFGGIPTWVGVYLVSAIMFSVAGFVLYRRSIRFVLIGKPVSRLDQPVRRIIGAIPLILGQSKVLQSVSLRDRAGLAHAFIFWGFLSFVLSYLVFTYGDSVWRPFSTRLLTETGVRVVAVYIDILAAAFLLVLAWAVVRRWVATPRRLSFDLTQKLESAIILALIASLMVLTTLAEAFYVASGGVGPTTAAPLSSAVGELLSSAGLSETLAGGLHELAWWAHLGVVLGFSVYIPLSKHMHLIAAPIGFLLRDLEPVGALPTPMDLETAETFGAARVQDFSKKSLLDGFSCAVCGRCTDICPANFSGKMLSPMHIVENLKEHLIESGPGVLSGGDPQEDRPLIGRWIEEEALWDCVTCGACESVCPVGVEHVEMIVDMRRNLVMEQASMPDEAMNALMSMEQRGHPWRGTQYSRTDWAEGLDVKTFAEYPDAEILFWVGCTAALE